MLSVAVILGAAALILPLVVYSQLPPRGLITGTVSYGTYSRGSTGPAIVVAVDPAANFALTFGRERGQDSYIVVTDRIARFSLTVPAGRYRIEAPFYDIVPTAEIAVYSGQHLSLDLKVVAIGQCLSVNDRISTPTGPVKVASLRAGMMVWTVDPEGHRVAAPALRVSHRRALPGQRMIALALADGRVVEASAGHPTTDGRHVADLRPGDGLDGSLIISVDSALYVGDTWDILPAGTTGAYWANDVLLESTLALSQTANAKSARKN
jgi:hypothetical protein